MNTENKDWGAEIDWNVRDRLYRLQAMLFMSCLSQLIVKAQLQVLYANAVQGVTNTARGIAECCICHETPP